MLLIPLSYTEALLKLHLLSFLLRAISTMMTRALSSNYLMLILTLATFLLVVKSVQEMFIKLLSVCIVDKNSYLIFYIKY